jgi:hypothetical protein
MERLGVAPRRLNQKALTAERLAEAIAVAQGAEMRQRARQLGERAARTGPLSAEGAVVARTSLRSGGGRRASAMTGIPGQSQSAYGGL